MLMKERMNPRRKVKNVSSVTYAKQVSMGRSWGGHPS
jgi:hypothetical protein